MAQIPTPPASPPSEKLCEASSDDTSSPDTLDALLEKYLHLLDQHQKLQAELGKQFASGFFSLTQANYSSPPGRRYGEDYYDERMKAIRTISVKDPDISTTEPTPTTNLETSKSETKATDSEIDLSTLLSFQLQTLSLSNPSPAPTSKAKSKPTPPDQDQEQEQEQDTSNTATPKKDDTETNTGTSPEASTTNLSSSSGPNPDEEQKPPPPPRNPLTWYGILVPPSLRNAQASFTSAVEGPIPALASIMTEMRDVERRVEVARRGGV